MKKVNISLNGKELTLNFGVNYFYKYFKEATGIDLLAVSFDISQRSIQKKEKIEAAKKAGIEAPEENGSNITENILYKMISSSDYFVYAAGIIYAGYAAEKSVTEQPIEHDFKYFQHSVYSMKEGDVADIINKYNTARIGDFAEGEVMSQPAN